MRLSLRLFASAACLLLAGTAHAVQLSTTNGATLGGLAFGDGDIADYDQGADTASLFFSETLFIENPAVDVDGFAMLTTGNLILTTAGAATIGGLGPFSDGDLIEYNPGTDTSTTFFNENLFTGDADIDAVHVQGDGTILMSTEDAAVLFGLSFDDGDIVLVDQVATTASLYFDESLFTDDEDIDAFHLMDDGRLLISTEDAAELGGLAFSDGDLVAYDPLTDTATLLMSESVFVGDENIDAVAAPEPGSAALLGLGLLALAAGSRRR